MKDIRKNFEILGAEASDTVRMQEIFKCSLDAFQVDFPHYATHLQKCNVGYVGNDNIEAYIRMPSLSSHVDNAFVVNLYRARYANVGTSDYAEGVLGVKAALDKKFGDRENNRRPWIAEAFADCTLNFLKDRPVGLGEMNAYQKIAEVVKSWEKITAMAALSERSKDKNIPLLPYRPHDPEA